MEEEYNDNLIQLAGESFKEHLTIYAVEKELGLGYTKARLLVQLYFHERSVLKCRHRAERARGISFSQIHASPKKISRMKHVYKVFQKEGTLEKAGEVLGITRERVRQLLENGTSFGLFHYDNRIETSGRIKEISESITKEQVENAICDGGRDKLRGDYGIGYKEVNKLVSKYKVSTKTAKRDRRIKNIMNDYNAVVAILGRHPSVGDLQQSGNTDIRRINCDISRYLGGMDKFRKDHGIKFVHFKRKHCVERARKVLDFCGSHPKFTRADLQKALGLTFGPAFHAIRDLRKQGRVRLVNVGASRRYSYYEVINKEE